jgi:subfamily B ATP-binding cassette protein MsbA
MKPLIDEGFTNKDPTIKETLPLLLSALFLARALLSFGSSYLSNWVAQKVVTDLRNAMFAHLIHLPVNFFDNNSSARLSSHVAHDAKNVTGAATKALTVLVRDTLTIIGLLAWLIWLDWKLTIITLTLAPLIAIVIRYFNKRLRKFSGLDQSAMAEITHVIEEASSNNRIIKIFGAEEIQQNKFAKFNEKRRNIAMRAAVASSAVTPIVELLTSLSTALVIAIALNASGEGTATAGGFMSFLTALLMLLSPIKRLASITSVIQRGLAAAEMVFSLLNESTEENKNQERIKKLQPIESIRFDNVSFAYSKNNAFAIEGLDLDLPINKKIALIGRSGSGKSTLVNLLAGFYAPSSGKILINNNSVSDLNPADLRKLYSYVSQDIRLFNDTILFNVSFGDPEPDPDKAREALEHAHAWEFVSALPMSMDTLVGQNGVKLSGGQRQRIAIARAFYKNAPVLILDEATSSLDSESEHAIQLGLNELTQGRTTITIAHRLSTIRESDLIIVFEQGKIIEHGTHSELESADGLYTKLIRMQDIIKK